MHHECFRLPHHACGNTLYLGHGCLRSRLPAVNEAGCVVELPVRLVPPQVLPCILQGRQRHDDTDGDQSYLGLEGIHHWDKVQNSQTHEVNVGQTVKLLEEVHGDEEEEGVFGGLDGVAGKVAVGLLRLLQPLIRQVGHQVAEVLLSRPLTSQGIPDHGQWAPPRHG